MPSLVRCCRLAVRRDGSWCVRPVTPGFSSARPTGLCDTQIGMAGRRTASHHVAAGWQLLIGRPLPRSRVAEEQITPVGGLSALSQQPAPQRPT